MLIRENEEKKLIMMIVTRQVPRTDIYYQTGKIFSNPNSDIKSVRDIDSVICFLNQDSPESWSFFSHKFVMIVEKLSAVGFKFMHKQPLPQGILNQGKVLGPWVD